MLISLVNGDIKATKGGLVSEVYPIRNSSTIGRVLDEFFKLMRKQDKHIFIRANSDLRSYCKGRLVKKNLMVVDKAFPNRLKTLKPIMLKEVYLGKEGYMMLYINNSTEPFEMPEGETLDSINTKLFEGEM